MAAAAAETIVTRQIFGSVPPRKPEEPVYGSLRPILLVLLVVLVVAIVLWIASSL